MFDTPEYQTMGVGTGKFVSKGWLSDQGRGGWEIQIHIYSLYIQRQGHEHSIGEK